MPLTPKLLTAATRCPLGPGSQSRTSVTTWKGLSSRSSRGLGKVNPAVGGSCRCRSASSTFSRLAMPAAMVVWPTLPLTEPIAQDADAPPARRNASVSALTSIGSPSGVPVPCASTRPISSGVTPARRHTRVSRSACARPLGAAMPLLRPSPLAPLARMTPCTWSPSARARASGFSTTAPTPSPRTIPSAVASKGALRPVGDRMPAALVWTWMSGPSISATPPATAISQSPLRMLWQARCTASSDDEQALSTAAVGPVRLRK
ncbi:hypothetical protein SHIRM173S_02297 [Streptomyces hirsutus]